MYIKPPDPCGFGGFLWWGRGEINRIGKPTNLAAFYEKCPIPLKNFTG